MNHTKPRHKITILSLKEADLLEKLIVKHGAMITFNNIFTITKPNLTRQETKNLAAKLVKNGWLMRIKRGLYSISELSSRGFMSVSPYVISNKIISDSYISFAWALQHYGFFDQMAKNIVSVSLKAHKSLLLENIEYKYVKTKPALFFGWNEVQIENYTVRIATPEKALIDMINFHKSISSIDLVIEKLAAYKNDLNIKQMTEYLKKFPITTIKIFGFIFDLLKIDSTSLHSMIKNKTSTHRMLKTSTRFNSKWRLYYDKHFDT